MINKVNKIVATIGLAITTSFATFATIKAKTKTANDSQNTSEYEFNTNTIDKKIKDKKNKNKDKKKDKKKEKNNLYSTENNSQRSKSIREWCESRVSQWRQMNGIPGLVVGVSLRGHNVWVYSEGFANIENNVKCSEETVMRIASISKSMTASLLAKLMQENKIDIDLPINTYLSKDQFPDKYWDGNKVDITVRQLACHLGGIRHYKKENESNTSDKTKDDKNKSAVEYSLGEFSLKEYYLKHTFSSVTESLKLFKDDPLVAKPGTKFVYTTFGWTLISAVIETQLNGEPFEKYLIKFLRDELGLNYTYLDQNEPIIQNRSSYYVKTSPNGRLINAPYVDNSYKWAGGGLLANVYDLLRFGNIMLYSYKGSASDGKKGYLNKQIVDQMWTPAQNTRSDWDPHWAGYGIGWSAIRDGKAEFAFCAEPLFPNLFSHTGGAVGASSVLLIEPNHELVVTIITNLQNASGVYRMALDIAKQFTKEDISPQQLSKLLSQIKSNSTIDYNTAQNQNT